MMRKISRQLRSPRGTTAVEYIVAIILVSMVILGMAKLMGSTIMGKVRDSGHTIDSLHTEKGYTAPQNGAGASNSAGSSTEVVEGSSKDGSKDGASNGGGAGSKKGNQINGAKDMTQHPDMLGAAEKPKKEAGFNPIIILLILFIIGVLVFVVVKGNKEGG